MDIEACVKELGIASFRGVFMRDQLPKKSKLHESGIVNLDISKNPGTHWVAYVKRGHIVHYYDSFGVTSAPPELIRYWGKNCTILGNTTQEQSIDQVICGHLCLKFINNYG